MNARSTQSFRSLKYFNYGMSAGAEANAWMKLGYKIAGFVPLQALILVIQFACRRHNKQFKESWVRVNDAAT